MPGKSSHYVAQLQTSPFWASPNTPVKNSDLKKLGIFDRILFTDNGDSLLDLGE